MEKKPEIKRETSLQADIEHMNKICMMASIFDELPLNPILMKEAQSTLEKIGRKG